MRKAFRILLSFAMGLFLVAVALGVFVQARGIPTYDVPKGPIQPVVSTPERIAHGESLALVICADCHRNPQTNVLSGQPLKELPPEFGKLYSANITQDTHFGIGQWTDDELVTLMRTGIGRDGRMRIVMPSYVHMSDEDLSSIIAFLRSSNPLVQPNPTPSRKQEPSFLAKVLMNTVIKPTPMPAKPILAPPTSNKVAFGYYLMVGRYKCYECHSKDFKTNDVLQPEKSKGYLGGGNRMLNRQMQDVFSRNLTPDTETGLGSWTEAEFIKAVKYGQSVHGPLGDPMPKYSRVSDEEVKALWAYLQTVPPLHSPTTEDEVRTSR